MSKKEALWWFLIGMALLALLSCSKDSEGFKHFQVPANQHYKKGWKIYPKKIGQDCLDFYFKTDDSWIWTDQYPQHVTGWSKIRGLSWGHHQKGSCIILAYRYDPPYMIIGGYGRADGVDASDEQSMAHRIDTIQPCATYHCRLSYEQGRYWIRINGKEWSCRAGKKIDWGYILNPHIGGDYLIAHHWNVSYKTDK